MAAIAADSYLLNSNGPVTIHEEITGSATTIKTEGAAPYAGESTSSPSGVAQPVWVGTEAIDVRGTPTDTDTTGGVTVYTFTHNGSSTFVTRGVLRTFSRAHLKGVAIYGGMPTPIGQVGRAFVYDHGHASHADRTEVARGAIEDISPSVENCTAQELGLASALFVSAGIAQETGRASYVADGLGSRPAAIQQSDGSTWSFTAPWGYTAIEVNRTGFAATEVDENGVQVWSYDVSTSVSVKSDFPTVRRPADAEAWERVNLLRVDDEGPVPRARAMFMDSDGDVYASPNGTDLETRVRTGDPLCHVFFPITWARSRNSEPIATIPTSTRLVEVNPVDAILEILTSTGYAYNGTHDNAPSVFGLSVDEGSIETASFTAVGNRLDGENITAGSVALLTSEDESLTDRLNVLLKTYGLGIVTTTAGLVRLVDMSFVDYDTSTTLDEGDLIFPAALTIGAGPAINTIVVEYDQPWIHPDDEDSKQIVVARAGSGGLMETLHRAGGKRESIKPWFAASVDPTSKNALGIRLSRIIAQTNSVVGTITCEVDPGYSGQIGDTVSVTLPAFPNAQDSGGMSGAMCRIIDRKHVSRPVGRASDELTLSAYGVTAADKPRQWAPSGVVSSVTSKLVFDLEPTTYSGGINYASDAVSFADGVDVDIYTENWSLRSSTSPGTVSSTSGNTMTLSVAAAGGGGDVTPNVGDKITLAGEQNQSVSEAAKWGWLSTSTPGYLWR
jgi:hypothetical protein